MSASGASYAASGVDIEAGDRAVALMRAAVSKTAGPEVVGGIGGFAGLFDASRLATMRRPLLATSTDGVGTKVVIARRTGSYGTIGIDLVGMVVDDLVVCGAEPLFMTDYIVCGKVIPERVAEIVAGVAEGCVLAGCALIGGETAEHPGHFGPDEFDLAGAATGVVEADSLLGPGLVKAGDVVLGLASSGLHSNGFSLVRQILDARGPGSRGGAGRARTAARRRARHADADLRQGLPRPRAGLRGSRVRPHHGRWPGREPGPGAAARRGRAAAPAELDATARLRPARRAWPGAQRRDGARLQHGCRDDRRRGACRRRPGHRIADATWCPGVAAGRDRRRRRPGATDRTASVSAG